MPGLPEMSDATTSASATLLQALLAAPDGAAVTKSGAELATYVKKNGLNTLYDENILPELVKASKSKSGYERESALVGLSLLFSQCGSSGGADPFFLPLWPDILERYQEVGKGEVVKEAAEQASKALLALVKPEVVIRAMDLMFGLLENSSTKWRVKVAALQTIATLIGKGQAQVADHLGEIIPKLTKHMGDTKAEVRCMRECQIRAQMFPQCTGLNSCRHCYQQSLRCPYQPRCHPIRTSHGGMYGKVSS